MTIKQSILDDYDHDYDPDAEADDALDTDLEDAQEPAALETLLGSMQSVISFGLTRSAHAVMLSADLLSGTALGAIATESLSRKPNDDETDLALESLGEKITETVKSWASKIVNFIHKSGEFVTNRLSSLWTKISASVKTLGEKAWDKTKATGRVIKAHPYKTVFAMLTAAAAIAGIVLYCSSNVEHNAMVDNIDKLRKKHQILEAELGVAYAKGSGAREELSKRYQSSAQELIDALKDKQSSRNIFLGKIKALIDKVTVPAGKITSEIKKDGKLIVELAFSKEAPTEGTAASLGWSQTAVRAIGSKCAQIWTMLKSGIIALGSKLVAGLKFVNDKGGDMHAFVGKKVAEKTKSNLTGWMATKLMEKLYIGALMSVVSAVYILLKGVVLKAFGMTSKTLHDIEQEAVVAITPVA
jgi:hypothetical protein